MKHWLIILFSISFFTISHAQNKGNSHFFKLIVENDKGEVFLIDFDGSWEVPGSRYKRDITIPQCLDRMAADHGITIADPTLEALVTFHHDVRDLPTMMFYYRAKYTGGDLVTPSWGRGLQWSSPEKAYELIPYPEMNHILQAIAANDAGLLTGALRITYDPETKARLGYEVIDELR